MTILLGAFSLLLAAPAGASVAVTTAERTLLQEMNRTRAAHGLAPLRIDLTLQRAARAHSRDMIVRGYFGHGGFAARMQRFGVQGPRVGENLAWGEGTRAQARSVVQMWLRSPGHRANLLRPGFRRVGVGRLTGTFRGRPGAAVVTANFAGR
jgi:uncharacterized protein YkwD